MSHMPSTGYQSYDPRMSVPGLSLPGSNDAILLERARVMSMMMQNRPLFPPVSSSAGFSLPAGIPGLLPSLPGLQSSSIPGLSGLPINTELIARYTAMQASLAMYSNPGLMSAALRQGIPVSSPDLPSPFLTPNERHSPSSHSFPVRSRSPSLSPGREDAGSAMSRAYPATPPHSSSPPCWSPRSTASVSPPP